METNCYSCCYSLNQVHECSDNVDPEVNALAQRLKTLTTNSDVQYAEGNCQIIDSKSRLQLRAPPPLNNLPLPNIGNGPISGSSIVSATSSNVSNSANDNRSLSGTWLANSNGLDSLLNHKPLTMCNDSSPFDDDLPSLFAKQVCKAYVISS